MRFLKAITLPLALLGGLMAWGRLTAQQDRPGRSAGRESSGARQAQLRGVASSTIFNSGSRYEARAAFKAWFDIMAQQIGFGSGSKVDVVFSAAEIGQRLRNRSVDVVMLGITDYLQLESSRLMVPVLTDARGAPGAAAYSYVLLVNPSGGTTALNGLRGKKLLLSSRGSGTTAEMWLNVLLDKEKLGRPAAFFASIKAPEKAQGCILPLFFGTVDACVVDEVNLNLAKEMNPQLGSLRVVARSRPLIEGLVAIPADPSPYRQELIDGMLGLNQDARGRQLLMVFDTERLVRIQPGDLDAAREIWRDYSRLSGSAFRSQAGGQALALESDRAARVQESH